MYVLLYNVKAQTNGVQTTLITLPGRYRIYLLYMTYLYGWGNIAFKTYKYTRNNYPIGFVVCCDYTTHVRCRLHLRRNIHIITCSHPYMCMCLLHTYMYYMYYYVYLFQYHGYYLYILSTICTVLRHVLSGTIHILLSRMLREN